MIIELVYDINMCHLHLDVSVNKYIENYALSTEFKNCSSYENIL